MNAAVERVLDGLDGARQSGSGWSARCPAHDDREPSLSVSEGVDGRVLVHCHAGCDTDAVLGALGLTAVDLFVGDSTCRRDDRPFVLPRHADGRVQPEPPEGFIVTAGSFEPSPSRPSFYTYVSADGEVIARKSRRSSGVPYVWERPSGDGWVSGTGGLAVPLYRLPEVLAAVESCETVYVCEGEKDADALAKRGLAATTPPNGATWKSEYVDVLAGATQVIVVADRDATGWQHAVTVARSLSDAGIEVSVVRAAVGKDASDHLHAGFSVDDLVVVRVGVDDSWVPSRPFTSRASPDVRFPVDVLPWWLRDMVEAVAEEVQVSVAMPASFALGVVGAAIGGSVVVANLGHTQPAFLWVAVLAAPGERKSPVVTLMSAPLLSAERVLNDDNRRERDEYDSDRRALEKRVSDLERKQAGADDTATRTQLQTACREAQAELRALGDRPPSHRLIIDDATPEAVVDVLAKSAGCASVISDEGAVFGQAGGRYSDGKARPEVYLKAFDGGRISVDRKGENSSATVERACLPIAVMVQPAVILGLLGNADLSGRGFPQRFAFVCPESRVGYRDSEPTQIPERVKRAFGDHLEALAVGARTTNLAMRIEFDQSASSRLVEWDRTHEAKLRPAGELAPIKEWASKSSGRLLRLVGLLALADAGFAPGQDQRSVDASYVDRAVRVLEFFEAHALALMGSVEPGDLAASELDEWLSVNWADGMTKRDAHQALRGRSTFNTLADFDAAMSRLEERGLWRTRPGARPRGKRGPTSFVIERAPSTPTYSDTQDPQISELGTPTNKFEDFEYLRTRAEPEPGPLVETYDIDPTADDGLGTAS